MRKLRIFTYFFLVFLFSGCGQTQLAMNKQNNVGQTALPPWQISRIKVLSLENKLISPAIASYVERAMIQARNDNSLVVIKLDSSTGMLGPAKQIVDLLSGSSVPVAVYVTPGAAKSASAGLFISYSANILAMSPDSSLGNPLPLISKNTWGDLSEETKKAVSDKNLVWAENIANKRGRSVSFIKDAIRSGLSATSFQALLGRWEDSQGTAVNAPALGNENPRESPEGVRLKPICDVVAQDLPDLLNQLNGREITTSAGKVILNLAQANIQEFPMERREKLLDLLANSRNVYLLLVLGLMGLVIEIPKRSLKQFGALSICALSLAVYGLNSLGLNFTGLELILLGTVLLLVEVHICAFGLFTLAGTASFIFGSLELFNQPWFFSLPQETVLAAAGLLILSNAVGAINHRSFIKERSLKNESASSLDMILNEKSPGQGR